MILCISTTGEIAPLVWRMKQRGASVQLYIHNPHYYDCYKGILDRVPIAQLKRVADKADVVVFDITRRNERKRYDLAMLSLFKCPMNSQGVYGPVADALRKQGKIVIGASEFGDKLEFDRGYGMEIAAQAGLDVPEYLKFDTAAKAVSFLGSTQGKVNRWVLKPLDNMDLDMTYVERYDGELAHKLEHEFADRLKGHAFILQKKIDGVEVSTEMWLSRTHGILHWNHTLENKKWLTGGLGPAIGSQSNVVWMGAELPSLKADMERASRFFGGYTGPVDVNSIVAGDKSWFLEWTQRFGYDAFFCLMMLLKTPPALFLTDDFTGVFRDGFAASERLTIPPFPYADGKLLETFAKDVSVDENLKDMPNFWAEDVHMPTPGRYACAGSDGILGVMAAYGGTIQAAYGRVYGSLESFKLAAPMQYRTDGVSVLQHRYEKLQAVVGRRKAVA